MNIVQKALESARHELTTLHGLLAADGAMPEVQWRVDVSNPLALIDQAVDAHSHAITEIADALGDETFNSINQAATGIRDLQAEIDALKAAQTWQPIESAPRDGLVLLLLTKYEVHSAYFSDDHQDWVSSSADNVRIIEPTSWLPAPTTNPFEIAKARGDQS